MKKPLVLFGIVLVGMVFSSSGCRKKEDTIVKITVRDESNSTVSGASVRLQGQSSDPNGQQASTLDKTSTTDGSGVATFDFNDVYKLGQAGVAVVNIHAEKGPKNGDGIVKVEQETTSEETVFIQ
jgi:hypothetical protein